MKLAILLTATIEPLCAGAAFTTGQRADMYRDTLRFYAKEIGRTYPIVFLENSDYDLTPWKREFADTLDIEWLQFSPHTERKNTLPFNQLSGKGYNELLMISGGVKLSKTLTRCTHFLKITGRYNITNVRAIISEIERRAADKVFMADTQDTKIYEWLGRKLSGHVGESRYWVAQVAWYRTEMMECWCDLDERRGQFMEYYMLWMSREYRHDPRFIFRFHTQARFNGWYSYTKTTDLDMGRGYRQDSLRDHIKANIRQLLRYIAPGWWI